MSRVTEPPEESPPAVSGGLSRDELFDVLANQRRRCMLQFFLRSETDVEFGRLVDHIAAWENEKSACEVTNQERKRVRTALRQNHLPKMEEAGLIEHHESTDQIELTEAFSDLDVYLQVVGRRIPYSVIYLGLSSLCIGLFLGAWLGVAFLASLSAVVGMATTVGLFGLTSIVHLYYTRHGEIGADVLSGFEP